jgi:hypothetical protein
VNRAPLLLFLAALALPLAGCGGGGGGGASLGTVPRNTNSQLVAKPNAKPISIRLHGRTSGVAHLSRAADGQKTAVTITLPSAHGATTAELAHGYCSKPTALTSTTLLGRVRGDTTSWTTPTPFAQLSAGPTAVVLRSPQHALVACGNVPRG